MSTPTDPTGSHHDPLDAVIADYLDQVEAGAVPDREALLALHPDLADRLRAFLADYDRLDRQAAELHLAPGYLVRLFNAATGLPPMAYLAQLRAEHAAVLLLHTDEPVTSIGRARPRNASRSMAGST